MRHARLRRVTRGVAVLAVVAWVLPMTSAGADATAPSSSFDSTVTVSRTHVLNGGDIPVDTRSVHLHVDRTAGLRDRDGIAVSWSGAHPTGGYYGAVNSADAAKSEYPMVLLECRGVDDRTAPVAQQIRPETCFTQTPSERYAASSQTTEPEWRMDRYATGGDLALHVQLPTGKNYCPVVGSSTAVHNVPFVGADGTTYQIGQGGCGGMPAEMSALSTTGLPSNTVYGVTAADGKGRVRFDVRTADSNASLGCSDTVPCALVAVPIMGISCDEDFSSLPADQVPTDPAVVDSDIKHCTQTGYFPPGSPSTSQLQQRAVTGALWWSASNWRGRVTVPLHFAPSSSSCSVVGGSNPAYFYGSELMIQVMTSWAPHFCGDPSLFTVRHVQTGEPQARRLLKNGTIEAALASAPEPDGFPGPVVSAPLAMTGFAVGFAVDDKDGLPVQSLRLTPRLLAKLLTESYPAINAIKNGDKPLTNNPIDMLVDPEFRALNPGLPSEPYGEPAATLLALSSDSDVMRALTAYINADPDARHWLDGQPDPWGMVVNPSYKGISLPTETWPLLDTFIADPPVNDCVAANPAPYLNLIAAPVQRIPSISLDLQYAISPSPGLCVPFDPLSGLTGAKLNPAGPEVGGHRFLIGITSLGDADRFGIPAASLLTSTQPGAPSTFTDATGRTFVAPDDTSLRAAARLLTADPAAKTWQVGATTGSATAYPGAMLVNALVPTSGLPPADAAHYAAFLRWAATSGQAPGSGAGALPPGYLPLTPANGLGAQSSYTLRAADAVAAQRGEVPELAAPSTSPSTAPAVPARHAPRPAPTGPGGSVGPLVPQPAGAAPAGPAPRVHGTGSAPPSSSVQAGRAAAPQAIVTVGRTEGAGLGGSSMLMPLLLLVGLGALAAALPAFVPRRRGPA